LNDLEVIRSGIDQAQFPVFFARNGERNRVWFKIGPIGADFIQEVGRIARGDCSFDDLVRAGEQRAGTSRPRARAAGRLITSSNFVACMTGKSAGLAPLSTRPA
jgi:hypothetical protein